MHTTKKYRPNSTICPLPILSLYCPDSFFLCLSNAFLMPFEMVWKHELKG